MTFEDATKLKYGDRIVSKKDGRRYTVRDIEIFDANHVNYITAKRVVVTVVESYSKFRNREIDIDREAMK